MWRKFLIVGLVLGISTIFLSASAWAEEMIDEDEVTLDTFIPCDKADLEGNWKGHMSKAEDDTFRNDAGFQDEFQVKIAADGTVHGGKYTEYEKKKDKIKEKGKYNIIGGTLKIDEKCIITGDLELSNGEIFKVTTGAILFKKDKPKELELGIGPDDSDFI